MDDDRPTADELRTLLVEILQGATDSGRWAALLGPVTVVPVWSSPKCNWRVDASVSAADRDAIDKAVAIVAGLHPYARD